jgi:major capsid protein gp7
MANTVNDTALTFYDFQKTLDPTGTKSMPVVEVLNQINAPLQDGSITPSNALLGHRVEIRASLPTTTIGQVNKGVPRSKGTTEQRNESMAMFVNRSVVDARQKDLWGEAIFNDKRATEDRAAVESMSQFVANQFAYGSGAANSGGFDGIATRMAALNQPTPGANGSQVWSQGTVAGGDGTSIYIVDWNSDVGVHWIYPANSATGGLKIADKGENVPTTDADGSNSYFAAVTEYTWSIGIAVEDPRRIARLANVDSSDANLGGMATQGLLADNLVKMLAYMPSAMGFTRVMYCHATLLAAWELQIMNKAAPLYLTMDEYLGEKVPHFHGVPIRRLDQLSLSESTVS